ncbi:hypothetical protein BDN72DRAFT_900994 [Pluteus cervinus]|uniref:Uncharacterized protein n=1 Tax=Pluteus cervinus TaxID=181527 RepID=A0ACD3AI76_9AGAR|nr:hypothetical protein BDN72DRAFT_900994 [Pluteus cervinus]
MAPRRKPRRSQAPPSSTADAPEQELLHPRRSQRQIQNNPSLLTGVSTPSTATPDSGDSHTNATTLDSIAEDPNPEQTDTSAPDSHSPPPSTPPQGSLTNLDPLVTPNASPRPAEVYNTPIKKRNTANMPYLSQVSKDHNFTVGMEQVMGNVVGPMPVKDFLTTFGLMKGTNVIHGTPKKFKSVSEAKDEAGMYQPWVKAVKEASGKNLKQVDTHTQRPFSHGGKLFGPDITTYHRDTVAPEAAPTKCAPDQAELFGECKYNESDDPFNDKGQSFERTTRGGRSTLGQVAYSVSDQLGRQFRTHVFSILIFRTYARLLRWDRTGVITTEKIDYVAQGGAILTFFRGLSDADRATRGVDETVTPYEGDDEDNIRKELGVTSEVPLFRVTVGDRDFIIGPATFLNNSSAFGRSTRCFRAYNCNPLGDEERVVLLKDSWRIYTVNRKTEWQIYQKLRDHKVRNIPRPFAGSDIAGDCHQTITQKFVKAPWSRCQHRLRTLQHSRLVVEALDCHLEKVGTIRNAIICIRGAGRAQADAAKVHIIHRDISAGNIMAKIQWADDEKTQIQTVEGYLIDWDLAVDLEDEEGAKEKLLERTGTWYFIAAGLIPEGDRPTPPQNRLDDVESLFNVLVYVASHFTPHKWGSSEALSSFVYTYFYQGSSKLALVSLKGSPLVNQLHHALLKGLIGNLAIVLAARYESVDDDGYGFALGEEGEDFGEARVDLSSGFRELLLKTLDNFDWFVDLVTGALELPGWSTDDLLIKHTLPAFPGLDLTSGLSQSNLAMANVSADGQALLDELASTEEELLDFLMYEHTIQPPPSALLAFIYSFFCGPVPTSSSYYTLHDT